MTPNIGVTCNVEDVRYGGLWTEAAAMAPLTYVRAVARAAGDGTAEAVEDAARRFMLGVLWHPEEDEADRLIGAFVQACR